VTNVNLNKLLEEHKKKRETNKDIIMKMITKKANPKQISRDPADNIVYAIDPNTDLSFLLSTLSL
jgi:translation initiation factor eIF-2B subunit epsilon